MTSAATGQLTAAEFEQAVQLFVEWWQAVASSSSGSVQQLCWRLECAHMPVIGQVIAYAQLERVVPAGSTEHQQQRMQLQSPSAAAAHEVQLSQQQQLLNAVLPVHAELDTEEDEAAINFAPAPGAALAAADAAVHTSPQAQQQQQQQHLHHYSIVYHDTYRVPVLYLRASELDGRPLSLGQLLQELPALQQYKEVSQSDWTFITHVDHPLQRVPCFMLHPCQTAARMQLLLQERYNEVAQAAAAAVIDSTPVAEEASGAVLASDDRSDSRCSRMPESAAAAAAGVMTSGGSLQCGGDEHNTVTGHALLLLYMRAWFSMVAGLLGIDMLPFYDDLACSAEQ